MNQISANNQSNMFSQQQSTFNQPTISSTQSTLLIEPSTAYEEMSSSYFNDFPRLDVEEVSTFRHADQEPSFQEDLPTGDHEYSTTVGIYEYNTIKDLIEERQQIDFLDNPEYSSFDSFERAQLHFTPVRDKFEEEGSKMNQFSTAKKITFQKKFCDSEEESSYFNDEKKDGDMLPLKSQNAFYAKQGCSQILSQHFDDANLGIQSQKPFTQLNQSQQNPYPPSSQQYFQQIPSMQLGTHFDHKPFSQKLMEQIDERSITHEKGDDDYFYLQ